MDYFHNFTPFVNKLYVFGDITSLILKKDVVGQKQGDMARFQLTGLQKGALGLCWYCILRDESFKIIANKTLNGQFGSQE
jgi:hypothetical protein